MSKELVVDTNVFLSDGSAIKKLGPAKINIPFIVLQELDKHKTHPGDVGVNARTAIKLLDELRANGNLLRGVKTKEGSVVKVLPEISVKSGSLSPDDMIIKSALNILKKNDNVTLVSNDICVRIKASVKGLKTEAFNSDAVKSDESELFTGITTINVSSEEINNLYAKGFIELADCGTLFPNQFVLLKDSFSEKHTAIARVTQGSVVKKIQNTKDVFSVKSKNLEQACAIDLLLDPEVKLVTLMGMAGTGKTLISLAAALDLVLNKKEFEKLIIMRPPIPMGKDIGYLPGPQPLDAKILTPDGWTTMGEIKVGSQVIGRDGKPTKVLGVFPKGKKTVYRITTTDGSSTECCEDHLWQTTTFSERKSKKKGEVRFTKDIIKTLKTSNGKINHHIPRNEPVHYNKKQLPISPYVLGVLLGDGCIKDNISFASKDQDIINKVEREIGQNNCYLSNYKDISFYITSKLFNNKPARPVTVTNLLNNVSQTFDSVGIASNLLDINKSTLQSRCDTQFIANNFQYNFEKRLNRWQNPIKNELDKLGLSNKKAWEKFIPDIYKYSSVDDRIELLRGLMDTDGTVKNNGETSYTTTSTQLAYDMQELVRSLGGRATIIERPIRNKNADILGRKIVSKRKTYEFTVSLPETINPFFLPRKANKFSTKYMHGVGIADIQEVGKKEVQCILVENSEHLYITDDFIVTHNTLEEKMAVWLGPVYDNIEAIMKGDSSKITLDYLISTGKVEVVPPTFIRGRSLQNSILLVDEAQSLTIHEVKTIATRMHESSKLILTGDVRQIDNMKLSAVDNGLSHIAETFKAIALAGHVTLTKGERGTLAALAAELL